MVKLKAVFVLLTVVYCGVVWGAPEDLCPVYRLLAIESRDRLHNWIAEPGVPDKRLSREFDFIDLSFEPRLLNESPLEFNGLQGANNGGVWEVRTKDGRAAALKVTPIGAYIGLGQRKRPRPSGKRQDHSYIKVPLAIQKRLAEEGMAPAMLGFLNVNQMKRLHSMSLNITGEPLDLSGGGTVGVVMELVPEGWSPVHGQVPGWLKQWPEVTLKRVVKRIYEMERTTEDLLVSADDAQVLLSPDGRVVLNDFELYRMAHESDDNDFKSLAETVISSWEMATGKGVKFDADRIWKD